MITIDSLASVLPPQRSWFHAPLLLLVSWLLSACGGGGGDGNAPQGLIGTEVVGGLELDWTEVAGADSYNVYFGDAPGFVLDQSSLLGNTPAPPVMVSFDPGDSGLFVFVVTAVLQGNESGPSSSFSYTLVLTGPDTLFPAQWHLKNTGQQGGTPGEDANCEPAWNAGATGDGVLIAIVDNGLQLAHPDLAPNVVSGSYNYLTGGNDPGLGAHGTACAGVAAAVANNVIGGRGAAYDASLVGYGLLNNNTDANAANAMTRNGSVLGLSSNSWGPVDSTGTLAASPQAWRDAIVDGVNNGRGGLGIVYTWAAGNGALAQGLSGQIDNSNYDGFANYYGVIAVGAVGDDGTRSFYSERGANLWVCAPSEGDNGHAITTTDLTGAAGYSDGGPGDLSDPNYTKNFNGTSSACPLVAGVAAQVLDVNPNLTWSDVRVLLAQTARQNDPLNAGWTLNGAGYPINHEYGFGVVDAEAAVAAAATWTPLADLTGQPPITVNVNLAIPDDDETGLSVPVNVSGSSLTSLEYVHVYVNAPNHTYWADLEISLESPDGTISLLAEPHNAAGGSPLTPALSNWRFGTARHLGEGVNGTWTVRVRDLVFRDTGTLNSVRLEFFGR